mgnify:CR=1 FL=1
MSMDEAATAAQRPHMALVGAGPGAADLLTLRAHRLLLAADVVVHDALVDLSVLEDVGARRIDVGKRAGHHKLGQAQINDLLVDLWRAGERVVRLKGGDPMVLGRGSEELLHLAVAGIPCEVVPGVTSATAAPLLAGIPVTHRGVADAFCVVSAHPRMEDGNYTLPSFEPRMTVVLLMGVRTLAAWRAALLERGYPRDTPLAFVTWAGRAEQRTLRTTIGGALKTAQVHDLQSPTVAIVGAVVAVMADYTVD